MIPTPPRPTPQFEPGTPVRVRRLVRCGGRRWHTEMVGVVEAEGVRPVGGMEMGGKSPYGHQPTIRLRHDDGEVSVIARDEFTVIEPIPPG